MIPDIFLFLWLTLLCHISIINLWPLTTYVFLLHKLHSPFIELNACICEWKYNMVETTHPFLKCFPLFILLVLLSFALSERLAVIIDLPPRFIIVMNWTCMYVNIIIWIMQSIAYPTWFVYMPTFGCLGCICTTMLTCQLFIQEICNSSVMTELYIRAIKCCDIVTQLLASVKYHIISNYPYKIK